MRPRNKVILPLSPGVLRVLTELARKKRLMGQKQRVKWIWDYKENPDRLVLWIEGVKRESRRSFASVLQEPELGVPEVGAEGGGVHSTVE